MKKLFKRNGTLYSMITGNYILFAVIVVLLALLSMTILNRGIDNIFDTYGTGGIIAQNKILSSENYDRLVVSRLLGKEGYIEVLDKDANIIYSSNPQKSNQYSVDELEYIPDVFGDTYYSIDAILKDNVLTGYVIHRYENVGDSENEFIDLTGVIILDKDRNIIYSDVDAEESGITEKEVEYLYGYNDDGYTYIQKYDFVTNNGEERILLIHSTVENGSEALAYRRLFIFAVTVFIVLLIILIIIFVLRMSFVVRRPLNMLVKAMTSYSTPSEKTTLSYSGPRELEQIISTFNDMSERLNDSEKKRIQTENEKQKMLADISHDLKTPITVIQGYAKAVAEGLVPQDEEKRYLDTICAKAENLSELINKFYEYSKLEHPEFNLVREKADLCEYFREYLAAKYEELDLQGFDMDIDIPDQIIEYSFDRFQLKRVFENIISNSVKANPQGTTIYAAMKQEDDKIKIYLGDNGVGIPDNIRDDIFNPFIVGNESRTSGQGTGLGLAIARLIVESHGGDIRLADDKNGRYKTLFEIVL